MEDNEQNQNEQNQNEQNQNEQNQSEQNQSEQNPLDAYKAVCARLGLTMCVYYISRILSGLVSGIIGGFEGMSGTSPAIYALHVAITVIFNYIIPILFAAMVFQSFKNYRGKFRILYKKPRRLARAFGSFPAIYGLGYGIALITLLISLLVSRASGGQSIVQELFKPTTLEPSTDIINMLTMIVLMVVIAPVFEEFMIRGIVFDALKPFGCGMAIIISSILFGLMHGSLYMLFYTTALGFALAYIRYATDSLFVVTILHAIVNAVSAGVLFMSSLAEIAGGEDKLINTVLNIYVMAMLILIVVGVIAFIKRIPVIRKYKIENAWTQIGPGTKTALFFLSVPVIIMLVFAFNEHSKNWLLSLFLR